MRCPNCEKILETFSIGDVEVERCENCGGIWFDKGELIKIRDDRDKNLSWLDLDLWDDANKLEADEGGFMICPKDNEALMKVKCKSSDIVVDVCLKCQGVWLDKGELDKIIKYLEDKVNSETLPEYLKDLGEELKDLLFEKGNSKEEVRNIFIIMKLIEYRLAAKYPKITEITSSLPD